MEEPNPPFFSPQGGGGERGGVEKKIKVRYLAFDGDGCYWKQGLFDVKGGGGRRGEREEP